MNYIGSKYSLLDFLQETIAEVTGYQDGDSYVFADLFAGTGIVGQTYKAKGCTVIANDIQYFSYVLNKHLIENIPELLFTSDQYAASGEQNAEVSSQQRIVKANTELLTRLNSLPLEEGFIYNNYCAGSGSARNYFTDDNGKRCDAIRMELERLRASSEISENVYFFYLASLINSIDRYANTASVYGAFLKHVKASAKKQFALELFPVIPGKIGKVFNEDINTLVRHIHGDVLYLDPPYNARQYSSNYHVLETIARYDSPELTGVTGLRKEDDQKSKFCSKRTVAEVFEDLIKNADFKYIFLSYNNEGLMSLDTIKEIMSRYGKYKYFTREYRRFKADKDANRKIAADSTTEYLHCLIK